MTPALVTLFGDKETDYLNSIIDKCEPYIDREDFRILKNYKGLGASEARYFSNKYGFGLAGIDPISDIIGGVLNIGSVVAGGIANVETAKAQLPLAQQATLQAQQGTEKTALEMSTITKNIPLIIFGVVGIVLLLNITKPAPKASAAPAPIPHT